MLMTILGFLTGIGPALAQIGGKIADLEAAKLRAQTDQERMLLNQQIEEAHDRRAALVAEAGSRFAGTINAVIRGFIAIGPASYVLKYYLWDKVIGAFVGCVGHNAPAGCERYQTDGLTTEMAAVLTAVIAFYFLYDMAARSRK